MNFVWIILIGIGAVYLGWSLLDGAVPIPKFLVAAVLVLAGISVLFSGVQMMPNNLLGNSVQKIVHFFDPGSNADNSGEQGQDNVLLPNPLVYVSGSWGEKFVRSNGYTYPFVFDEAIQKCVGFTLDYEIEAVEGDLSGNFRYEVYVRQTNGKWKSVELFQMEGNETAVEIWFDKAMDIDAVAVVCGKKDDISYTYMFGVRDVRYE